MSERTTSHSNRTQTGQPASGSLPQSGPTGGYRRDDAHADFSSSHLNLSGSGAAGPSEPKSIAASERELQLQARQISQHLRSQFAELDRREKNLNEQMSALDQEQRAARLQLQQLENELLDREASLRGKETELEHRLRKCEQLVASLDQKREELDSEWERLEQKQKVYREELKRELLQNWNALDGKPVPRQLDPNQPLSIAATQQNSKATPDAEQLKQQLANVEQKLRADLEAELTERLEAAQRAFQNEKQLWEEQRTAEFEEIERERQLTAEATQRAQNQLEELRVAQQTEFDALREKTS
ncbi:MAG: hypothetical protein R3C11_02740 [Planctomycetaceae bacterium]